MPASADPDILNRRGERRQVTAIFVDVVGFSDFASTADAEDLQDWLDGFYGSTGRIVDAGGGEITEFLGDGIVAVFGLTRAEELAARVRAGEDIAEVARSVGATLITRENTLQDEETQQAIGPGVLQGLFGQAKGQVFVQPASQTAFAVGVVDDIRASDAATVAPIAERIRPRITQDLVSGLGDSAIGWTQANSKASYDVAAARQALGLPEEAPAAPAGAAAGAQ